MDSSSFRNKFINIKKNNFNSSTEVYYGRSNVGIPFTWESQPGTPKVKYYDRPLPPLTPPPSFIYSSTNKKSLKSPSKSKPFISFIPKLNLRRNSRTPPSPISSLSSSSSSHSVPASPFTPPYRRGSKTSWTSENYEGGSPVSTLCFGVRRGGPRKGSSNTMKALLEELE